MIEILFLNVNNGLMHFNDNLTFTKKKISFILNYNNACKKAEMYNNRTISSFLFLSI